MTTALRVGEYRREGSNASRSPCPVVNALSNHGYLKRDGKFIAMEELNGAMAHVGMSSLLGLVFAKPTYFEYQNPAKAYMKPKPGFVERFLAILMNPYTFFDYFGCWYPNQKDASGKKYLDLENLAAHGAIEHDISLSRRDIGQKQGNNDPQEDLIEEMLQYSDGETMAIEDLAEFIKMRIQQQLKDNPDLIYGPAQHQVNCGQVALMMGCFGNGKTIPVKYVKAIFQDERLPYTEGWTRRYWWSMGLVEFFGAVKNLVDQVKVTF